MFVSYCLLKRGKELSCYNFVMKVKVKFSLCFLFWRSTRHKGVLGSGGIAPCILDLGTRWRWVVSFTTQSLYSQGKGPWCPLDRSLSGPQSQSGRGGEEKNSQPRPGLEPRINWSYITPHNNVTIPHLTRTLRGVRSNRQYVCKQCERLGGGGVLGTKSFTCNKCRPIEVYFWLI
jgi:hypothetical protein